MAAKKKKLSVKHKKTAIKKNIVHEELEKIEKVDEQPEKQEVNAIPAETKPSESSPIVGASGVISESPKADESQTVQQPQVTPDSQPGPATPSQSTDTQALQPESAGIGSPTVSPTDSPASEDQPVGKITQDPLATSGVVRDKGENETEALEGGQSIDEPKNNKLWIIIGVIVVILVLVGGGLWYFRENVIKKSSVDNNLLPTATVVKSTPAPATDSAKMKLDLSEYSIKILNGSGISGIAGETRDILESEDFNVEEIGNAERSDYEGTVVKAKVDVSSEFLKKLKTVLEENYILDSSEELEESEEVDVVVIVGSDKQL